MDFKRRFFVHFRSLYRSGGPRRGVGLSGSDVVTCSSSDRQGRWEPSRARKRGLASARRPERGPAPGSRRVPGETGCNATGPRGAGGSSNTGRGQGGKDSYNSTTRVGYSSSRHASRTPTEVTMNELRNEHGPGVQPWGVPDRPAGSSTWVRSSSDPRLG